MPYKKADFLPEFGGWVCRKTRVRDKREFKEKDLMRILCNFKKKNGFTSDFVNSAQECLEITQQKIDFCELTRLERHDIMMNCLDVDDIYSFINSKNSIFHRELSQKNNLLWYLFETMEFENKQKFMSDKIQGGAPIVGLLNYFNTHEKQKSILEILFNNPQSTFHQNRDGFCAIWELMSWLNGNSGTIQTTLVTLIAFLPVIGVVFPAALPFLAPILIVLGSLLTFVNVVINYVDITTTAYTLFGEHVMHCSKLPVDLGQLGRPDIPPPDLGKKPGETVVIPDFISP